MRWFKMADIENIARAFKRAGHDSPALSSAMATLMHETRPSMGESEAIALRSALAAICGPRATKAVKATVPTLRELS